MESNLYNWRLRDLIACSEKELETVVPLIEQIVGLADKARHEGLLSLDDDVEDLAEPLLRLGIRLVVDGVDPDTIRWTLETRILTSKDTGVRLVKDLVLLEGTLGIHRGENPALVAEKLASFLGPVAEKAARELLARLDKRQADQFEALLGSQTGEPLPPLSPATSLIEPLAAFSDLAIQKMLREVDISVLSVALKGAGGGARQALFRNMSRRAGSLLAEDMRFLGEASEDAIVQAQEQILAIVKKLVEAGEISE